MLDRIRAEMHVHCLAIEYPGYGVSAGEPSESSVNKDVFVVYSFLAGVLQVCQPLSRFVLHYTLVCLFGVFGVKAMCSCIHMDACMHAHALAFERVYMHVYVRMRCTTLCV